MQGEILPPSQCNSQRLEAVVMRRFLPPSAQSQGGELERLPPQPQQQQQQQQRRTSMTASSRIASAGLLGSLRRLSFDSQMDRPHQEGERYLPVNLTLFLVHDPPPSTPSYLHSPLTAFPPITTPSPEREYRRLLRRFRLPRSLPPTETRKPHRVHGCTTTNDRGTNR